VHQEKEIPRPLILVTGLLAGDGASAPLVGQRVFKLEFYFETRKRKRKKNQLSYNIRSFNQFLKRFTLQKHMQ